MEKFEKRVSYDKSGSSTNYISSKSYQNNSFLKHLVWSIALTVSSTLMFFTVVVFGAPNYELHKLRQAEEQRIELVQELNEKIDDLNDDVYDVKEEINETNQRVNNINPEVNVGLINVGN